ncbi:MAG: short-chain fatty acids transporter [Vicingaceae bacterium]|jgi:short-chain fatty acids transporter
MEGIIPTAQLLKLPSSISFSETVFSPMNIFATAAVLIVIPLLMYLIGKSSSGTNLSRLTAKKVEEDDTKTLFRAKKIDYSTFTTKIVGSIILLYLSLKVIQTPDISKFAFITPNFINLCLLGIGFFFHKNIVGFLKATDHAIGGAS